MRQWVAGVKKDKSPESTGQMLPAPPCDLEQVPYLSHLSQKMCVCGMRVSMCVHMCVAARITVWVDVTIYQMLWLK